MWDSIFNLWSKCTSGVPLQMAEKQLHGVMVGFGQLLDQFLQRLNLLFGFFNFCPEIK